MPELGKIIDELDRRDQWQRFLDTYAEALIARHLRRQGCELRVEVPTRGRKLADLRCTRDGCSFLIHIKRLNDDKDSQRRRGLVRRLDSLARVRRPLILQVDFDPTLTDVQMQDFVRGAKSFAKKASVRDNVVIRAHSGARLGSCEIIGEHSGEYVRVGTSLPISRSADDKRFTGRLKEACGQFDPREENIILAASAWEVNRRDLQRALLGTSVAVNESANDPLHVPPCEPTPGSFWGQYSRSRVVGWFYFSPGEDLLQYQLWVRPCCELDQPVANLLRAVFGPQAAVV